MPAIAAHPAFGIHVFALISAPLAHEFLTGLRNIASVLRLIHLPRNKYWRINFRENLIGQLLEEFRVFAREIFMRHQFFEAIEFRHLRFVGGERNSRVLL